MTPEQTKMARHALGLEQGPRVSYRNRYVAGLGSPQEAAWDDLVRQGMAERGSEGLALVGFCLTEAGARAVLRSDEDLDREDFPPLPKVVTP